jgi:predicted dehydrogenase
MNSSPSDRRRFLKNSTALALAGYFVNEARGNEAESPVRVAVVGTGARGSDLIRSLNTIERAKIVAVCDDYPPHLEQGVKYAGPEARGCDDYSQMLREIKPEAVVVATPLYRHFAMCMEALDAGCAVFCEKTMCHTVEQARDLVQAVEKAGAVFQVGLQRRANAIYAQAQAMVETGMLGQITAIKCQWHRNNNWRRPVPVKRDHPQWRELEQRLNWRLYWEYSQGLMTELASHQLDVANRLLNTMPKRVIGSGGIDYWRDGREVFDNVFCVYEYELPAPTVERNSFRSQVGSERNEFRSTLHSPSDVLLVAEQCF